MSGKEIQNSLIEELVNVVDAALVVREWSVRHEAEDTFADLGTYAPRLDIAIGPFNLTFEGRHVAADAIRAVDNGLIRNLRSAIETQNSIPFENSNPRCLVAIEVEYSTSSKHILGGITNASMLGLYGVIVGPSEYISKIRRIHTYVKKLKEVGKAHHDLFGNVACFETDEFIEIVRASVPNHVLCSSGS